MKTKNERHTEDWVFDNFKKNGFDPDKLQFQGSYDSDIQKCLNSKKTGTSGKGKPEGIYRFGGLDVLVCEFKGDTKNHTSDDTLTEDSNLQPQLYAEDGLIHYMKGLKKDWNVIGLAVSGSKTDCIISWFRSSKNGKIERLKINKLLSMKDCYNLLKESEDYHLPTEAELGEFAKELHNFLRDKMSLKETLKPELVAAVLFALSDKAFVSGYRNCEDSKELVKFCEGSIDIVLDRAKIPNGKQLKMLANIKAVLQEPAVGKNLSEVIKMVHRNLLPVIESDVNVDLLGDFYGEFIRYSGGDGSGLGIVLTPKHICELFCKLVNLSPEHSVVLDTCCGTGGFLLAAMTEMLSKTDNPEIQKRIRKYGISGIEMNTHMFTLACANMIFRKDGKSNMFNEDCLDLNKTTEDQIRNLCPNVIFLNPPYSQKEQGKKELDFVLKAADLIDVGGTLVAIVPMSCTLSTTSIQKKLLLERHTLEAVMSMPDQLFPSVGTVTAICVFKCHQPHPKHYKTWFGYWKDDGFKLRKGKRIEVFSGSWEIQRDKWLYSYHNKSEIMGQSVKKVVSATDEWCAEAYLETDYTKLSESDFEQTLKNYNISCFSLGVVDSVERGERQTPYKLNNWKQFQLTGLFEFTKGENLSKETASLNEGDIPYLSSSKFNNGITAMTSEHEGFTKFQNGVLTIQSDGTDIATCFYQPKPFYALTNVTIAKPKGGMSPETLLFISTIITNERYRFNYGRKFNGDRMNLSIWLPSTKDGSPDYELMDKYMKSLRFSKILESV